MKIVGANESLIEWKGHLSFVIFIAGCNFRCPGCYVPHLVLPELYEKGKVKEIKQEEVLEKIQERKNFIDAICITGGEPTVHPELYNFLQKINNINKDLKIRLETNGSNPKLIEKLIKSKLIDSIALDIKNSKEKYQETTNTKINIKDIESTLDALKKIEDYEIRTTLVPGMHNLENIKKIAEWLKEKGINKLVLQQFRSDLPNEQTLNLEFLKKGNFPAEKLKVIKAQLEKSGIFKEIEVRGKE